MVHPSWDSQLAGVRAVATVKRDRGMRPNFLGARRPTWVAATWHPTTSAVPSRLTSRRRALSAPPGPGRAAGQQAGGGDTPPPAPPPRRQAAVGSLTGQATCSL
jgi:hypothetical protein